VPPDALVASLAKETLLQPGSIRSLFKKHYSQKKKAAQWEAPHQATGAGGDAQAAAVENGSLKYDASLVGRRCMVLWCPEDGDEEDEDYYSATIVAYNSRCAPRKGRFSSTLIAACASACNYHRRNSAYHDEARLQL